MSDARLPASARSGSGVTIALEPLAQTAARAAYADDRRTRAVSGFANLHVRSDYSLFRAASTVAGIVERAAAAEQPAVAITDYGVVSAFPELEREAERAGVKPIFGLELPLAARLGAGSARSGGTVVLLSATSAGLRELERLSTELWLDDGRRSGDPSLPRGARLEALAGRTSGLIALTGGTGTALARLLAAGSLDAARTHLAELRTLFDEGCLFVQVGPEASDPHRVRERAGALAAQADVPLVASALVVSVTDAPGALAAHRVGQRELESDPVVGGRCGLAVASEMAEVDELYPGSIEHAAEIAERCEADLGLPRRHRHLAVRPSSAARLRTLASEGLERRFDAVPEEAAERLRSELDAIEGAAIAEEFLTAARVVAIAREAGALVGPGRGAVAGSLLSYCLGISEVDPIEHGLLSERLLGSGGPPYIAIDVDAARHGSVADAVFDAFGERRVRVFSVARRVPRQSVRLAARFLGRDSTWSDELAALVPESLLGSPKLRPELEGDSELAGRYAKDPESTEVLDLALDLDGLIVRAWPHATAHVFADRTIEEKLPLRLVADHGEPRPVRVTQYARAAIERSGLVSLDVLGFNDLTLIREAHEVARAMSTNVPVLSAIPLDDADAYRLLARGTLRLPLFEGRAARELLQLIQPRSFADLAAAYSLHRPYAEKLLARWLSARNRDVERELLDERLEPILRDTHGVVVYQEQIMKIAQELGGLNPAESNELRRAVGKKQRDEMRRWQDRFVTGALARGVTAEAATRLWHEHILEPCDWAFCKAHAVSYAHITYWAAWLCANHPGAWLAAEQRRSREL